ncbi:MAG: pyridoxamine 5'-phosphate oxidase family protein [Mycobacteriaceae bacterium]|nr:pyridoxamine 5'-phosphate oxidase family protein [Mycobacteriaceae bacterium]
MTSWAEFTESAPRIAAVFTRRHAATKNLCMMATLRADGSPRISPLEPRMSGGELILAGMPNTRKFDDLLRDPRFCLHTATVDTMVGDGDAKLWGTVVDRVDAKELQRRFAEELFAESGFDIRDRPFDHFFLADIAGASTVEVADNHLEITIWKPGHPERVVERD